MAVLATGVTHGTAKLAFYTDLPLFVGMKRAGLCPAWRDCGTSGPGLAGTAVGLNRDITRKEIGREDKPAAASMIAKVFFLA
jgi:hypothetical protein